MLETFLSGESFADILTEVGYYIDVGEQDKALAEQIARDQETLAAIHATVVATQRETEALRVETARQKVELDKQLGDLETARAQLKVLERQTARALASQKAAYAKMAKNKASAQKALDQAAAAQRQLQAQIDRLIRERTQFGNIPSRYNGTLIWPMAGHVTQNFGCTGFSWEPPLGSCEHFHKGIDLAAPMYEPIRAAGDGVVVFSGFNPYDPVPKAYIIIIAHSDELLTWYAHLDASTKPATVRAGDTVKQGEVIGYEGTTGRSTGPHLHWAVEYQNTFTNPRLFV
jgi:murein DD-endopeptidase MepM/ murein hydrolase activator NlpD